MQQAEKDSGKLGFLSMRRRQGLNVRWRQGNRSYYILQVPLDLLREEDLFVLTVRIHLAR